MEEAPDAPAAHQKVGPVSPEPPHCQLPSQGQQHAPACKEQPLTTESSPGPSFPGGETELLLPNLGLGGSRQAGVLVSLHGPRSFSAGKTVIIPKSLSCQRISGRRAWEFRAHTLPTSSCFSQACTRVPPPSLQSGTIHVQRPGSGPAATFWEAAWTRSQGL